jgi:hypothetical protein
MRSHFFHSPRDIPDMGMMQYTYVAGATQSALGWEGLTVQEKEELSGFLNAEVVAFDREDRGLHVEGGMCDRALEHIRDPLFFNRVMGALTVNSSLSPSSSVRPGCSALTGGALPQSLALQAATSRTLSKATSSLRGWIDATHATSTKRGSSAAGGASASCEREIPL